MSMNKIILSIYNFAINNPGAENLQLGRETLQQGQEVKTALAFCPDADMHNRVKSLSSINASK